MVYQFVEYITIYTIGKVPKTRRDASNSVARHGPSKAFPNTETEHPGRGLFQEHETLPYPESTEGGRRVSDLKPQEGAPVHPG